MQYFAHRLFWQNEKGSIVVGDLECSITSEITLDPVSLFTVAHPSLHSYPGNLIMRIFLTLPLLHPCPGNFSICDRSLRNIKLCSP